MYFRFFCQKLLLKQTSVRSVNSRSWKPIFLLATVFLFCWVTSVRSVNVFFLWLSSKIRFEKKTSCLQAGDNTFEARSRDLFFLFSVQFLLDDKCQKWIRSCLRAIIISQSHFYQIEILTSIRRNLLLVSAQSLLSSKCQK